MKLLAILIAACLIIASCKKDNDPIPPGIQRMIDSMNTCVCEPYITVCKWNDKKIYGLGYGGPLCSWIPTFYYANGTLVKGITSPNYAEFIKEVKYGRRIWQCKG